MIERVRMCGWELGMRLACSGGSPYFFIFIRFFSVGLQLGFPLVAIFFFHT